MDSTMFEKEVYKHKGLMAAVISRIVKSPEDIDDVLQLALMNAYKGMGTFRGDSGITTWLYTIAKRQALMWHRAHQRRQERVTPLTDAIAAAVPAADWHSSRPDVRYSYKELVKRISDISHELSEMQQMEF